MPGYLYLQTHPEHPGLVRFLAAARPPDPDRSEGGSKIRYIAHFNDIGAARMHVQNALHGRLVDLDARMYRTSLAQAIAVVEADNLKHERIWIDPGLDREEVQTLDRLTAYRRKRLRSYDRFWQGVGIFFLIYLAARAIGLF